MINMIPHIVVGMYHPSVPKKSAIYGAAIVPTWAIVELSPMAEFRSSVGNISAVCSIITANAALTQVRLNIAMAIAKVL